MKKIVKFVTVCAAAFAWAMLVPCIYFGTKNFYAFLAMITMGVALVTWTISCLVSYSKTCAGNVVVPDTKSPDGISKHHEQPLWAFLGAFIMDVVLLVIAYYFATHLAEVRDLMNFVFFSTLGLIATHWVTHPQKKRK